MTRQDIIAELTANELDWLVNNADRHNMDGAVEFFSTGNGFFYLWGFL